MPEASVVIPYQPATPWQELGASRTGYTTVEDALQGAKLDWTVRKEQLYWVGPHGDGSLSKVPDRHAIVTSNHKYLGTVGGVYEPLQNADAFGVLDTACKEFGVTIVTAGALSGGRRVWMQAKLPKAIEPIDGDTIDGYFLIASSHDGSAPYTARPTPIRVVCLNTLMAALKGTPAVIMLRHTHDHAAELGMVAKMVEDLMYTLTITGETFTALARRRLTKSELSDYIDTILGIESGGAVSSIVAKRRDTVRYLVEHGKGVDLAPGSAWAAYNAFTEYADHVRPAEVDGVARRTANESAVFGANARLKQQAFDLARQLLPA